jgi:hypothetical protein
LHKYDPPDLVSTNTITPKAGEKQMKVTEEKEEKVTPGVLTTPTKAKEIEEAAAKGMLVDFSSPGMEVSTPISVHSPSSNASRRNLEEEFGGDDDDFLGADIGDDSDDDLL